MIIFEMKKDDIEYANKLMNICDENTGILSPHSFSGIDDIIAIGIIVTPMLLKEISKIIVEMIKKDKRVRVKVGDIEIDGLTEENALKKLEDILEYSNTERKAKNGRKK